MENDLRYLVTISRLGTDLLHSFDADGEPVHVLYHPESTDNGNVEVCRLTALVPFGMRDGRPAWAATLVPVCDVLGGEVFFLDGTPTYSEALTSALYVVTLADHPSYTARAEQDQPDQTDQQDPADTLAAV